MRDGRSVELVLAGPGADAVDAWSVDWSYDGKVFRHRFHTARRTSRERAILVARHVYEESRARDAIAVRVADAGGATRHVVVAPAG